MTVFVAGIHGVGKTYLCKRYAEANGIIHESSSSLIRKENGSADWSTDKRTSDLDSNQTTLKRAVQKISESGINLLLDGHFVLINHQAELVHLDEKVFSDLYLTGVVLIEASEQLIIDRLHKRDSTKSPIDITEFMNSERICAQAVCRALSIPLHILREPQPEEFSKIIDNLFKAQARRP